MLDEGQLKAIGIKKWSALAENFKEADLLLGNGFSSNITGHFDYDSLFNKFLNSRNDREKRIFRSFKTNNFERIQ